LLALKGSTNIPPMRHAIHILALVVASTLWFTPASGRAELKTEQVEYKDGEATLQGFVAWDDAAKGKRPGILVVHEWWGHNEHAREQARRLAKAGYVGFALDMYGKGKLAKHPTEAKAFVAEATANPAAEKARFEAALAELKKRPQVDAKKIGVIGYCFGGAVALDMARMGVPLAVVATFHGALGTKQKAKPGLKPRILVLTGADDPMVGPDQVAAFKQEMTAAKARFEVIEYAGAKHAFTNPDADKAGVPGLAYDAKADGESWAALVKVLGQVFGPR
jgi:dienelactone hydrolase